MGDLLELYLKSVVGGEPEIVVKATQIKKEIQDILFAQPCLWFVDSPVDVPERLELSLDVTEGEIEVSRSILEQHIESGTIPMEALLWVNSSRSFDEIVQILQTQYPELQFNVNNLGNEYQERLGECVAYSIKFKVSV